MHLCWNLYLQCSEKGLYEFLNILIQHKVGLGSRWGYPGKDKWWLKKVFLILLNTSCPWGWVWGDGAYERGFLSMRHTWRKCLSTWFSTLYACFYIQKSHIQVPMHCCSLLEVAFPFRADGFLLAWLPSWAETEACCVAAAPLSVTQCPGAQVSSGKSEMAAGQVPCWLPCSSFLLLAEQNLIFLAIIMGCEEQLLN